MSVSTPFGLIGAGGKLRTEANSSILSVVFSAAPRQYPHRYPRLETLIFGVLRDPGPTLRPPRSPGGFLVMSTCVPDHFAVCIRGSMNRSSPCSTTTKFMGRLATTSLAQS